MAPRVSRSSAGSRKPASAAPTAGRVRVQRNANGGRVLSYFRSKAFEILNGSQAAGKILGADRRNALYLTAEQGILPEGRFARDSPHPPPNPIVVSRFIAAARRPHAGAALSGVDRL
jgi:hypothetical protein